MARVRLPFGHGGGRLYLVAVQQSLIELLVVAEAAMSPAEVSRS